MVFVGTFAMVVPMFMDVLVLLGLHGGVLMHVKHADQEEHRHDADQHPQGRRIHGMQLVEAVRQQVQHRHPDHKAAHPAHKHL
jgi:hypothetical protein